MSDGSRRRSWSSAEDRRAYDREWGRATYAIRRRAGICVRCGRSDVETGHSLCAECRRGELRRYHVSGAARRRERERARLEAGLCVSCGGPLGASGAGSDTDTGGLWRGKRLRSCADCRAAAAAYARARRASRDDSGRHDRCARCGQPLDPARRQRRRSCDGCLAKGAAYARLRRARIREAKAAADARP